MTPIEEPTRQTLPPFDMGIKEFKRLLATTALSKSQKNQLVREYKQKVYERVAKVKKEIADGKDKE